ncbi:MAG: hypothetical protein JJ975_01435 [Bacteroidia bacterium]|nr:hypothetical protein [Bacteroidia bacterium]
MKTIDINNHFTELDRSILEGETAYSDYFNYVRDCLNILLSSFDNITTQSSLEIKVLKSFSQKFLNTIEAFRLKYAFEDESPMRIDLTESGFPNFMEFKKLNDDIDRKETALEKLPSQDSLKQSILDHLIRKKEDPRHLLKQLSRSSYYIRLKWSNLFTEFTPGTLELLNEHTDKARTRTYFYSWASYDSVTNKPFIYTMVFDNKAISKEGVTDVDKDPGFVETIKRVTHNTSPLKVIASDIDNAYESVMPKVIKRIEIGPIFGKYAQDKHPHTLLIKKQFSDDDFIFTYNTEIVFSTGEKRTKSFLSKGELRQVFYVDESNKECMEKMVSDYHTYLITSHKVLQYLNDNEPDMLKDLSAPVYTYN